jgi:beta-lactamase regulating signal transducer with metallopeptidase domain
MDRLISLLESESCRNLLLALAHTLWQGALAAGLLLVYLRRTPAQAVNRRYAAGLIALAATVLAALLTWSILSYRPCSTRQAPGPVVATEVGAAAADPTPSAHVPEASQNEQPASAALEPSHAPALWHWQVRLVEAWMAGVALMLMRLVVLVVGAGGLRRSCQPPADAQMLALIEQLREGMGIRRRIHILVGERLSTPGVIGCFWPTLLLPVSMVSGIPAEDLQAILVHELAHIRRYDYLVNFFQMVVEALLFFNPAVWWISRQVRIEREACCDAAGVLWTGQRTRYAEVLVAWAHQLGATRDGTPAPAVGFGQDLGGGNILDRVRRILIAGHQPRPHVPWHIATAMIVLSLACLVALQQATGLAVHLAGRILTPQERIDKIAGISREYGYANREYGPEDKIEVSGVVRTWDGAPLPRHARVVVRCEGRRSSASVSLQVSQEGVFRTSVDYGRVYVAASAEGYAAAFAGPFEAQPGGIIQGIELVLENGFRARIQTVDESGRPVPDAELVGSYSHPEIGSFSHGIKLTTDVNGIATIEHAAAKTVIFQINADGFESERGQSVMFQHDKIGLLRLRRSRPTTGVVLSQATGQPIAGAEIRIMVSAQGPQSYGDRNVTGPADAVTDANGRFELSRLRRDRRYLLFVQAPGYGYRYVPDVQTDSHNIRVLLGEKKVIRGTITGDLSLLATDPRSGRPIIGVENCFTYPNSSGYVDSTGKSPAVTVRDGVGHFETDDFWGETVTLLVGDERVRLDPLKDRLDNIMIDLRRPAQRRVVLRFATPEGGPPMEGGVRIYHVLERAPGQEPGSTTPQWLDIQAGQASCEIPVPSRLSYSIDFHQGKRPVGYWFHAAHGIDIPPGNEPFVIEVPVVPAGAIYGKILRPNGSRADKAHATLLVVKKPGTEEQWSAVFSELSDALSDGVDRGTFNATPLPWGGTYAVVVYEDYAFAMSDAFTLDEKNPIVNVDLELPQGVDVVGQLLDVDGTPARNDVALQVSVKRGEASWSLSGLQTQPDEAGRFVFKNVNVGFRGECSIRVIAGRGYRPLTHKIRNPRAPVVIHLEKGCRVTGTVLDDGTSRPVPGVEVYAYTVEDPKGRLSSTWEMLEAESRTDEQGRFTFSNMAARRYSLNIRTANLADPRRPVIITGGQKEPVVLRIRIPAGSELKPQEP